ncbi:MAG: CoA transferase, partial [Dehalococcoidia bacterium]|nr:CoA transferase [Dehalococcoidia bacterium]
MVGKLRYPGAPIHSPRGWWQLRSAAPLLGEHNQEVLKEGWRAPQENGSRPSAGSSQSSTRLPLEGIRVLDITLALAGPYGSMFLADMGAEVIRVEPRSFLPLGGRGQLAHPDPEQEKKAVTSLYPNRDPGERPWNRSSGFNTMARNKHSITVELATPEGRDVFRRLVEVSDLFVQNSVSGAMDRLGIGYDTLSQWNPRLSMVAISGPGQTGPWKGYRGWGYIFESLYGYGSIIGYPDMDTDGVPVSVPSDPTTGVTAVIAAIMALHWREKTGKGCFIDTTLGETFATTMSEHYMDYQMNQRVPGRLGNRHRSWVQGAYPCAGNDEWIAISIGKIEQWHALCRLMGKPELIQDERFGDMQLLHTHHDEVDQIIETWTRDQDNYDLFHRLQEVGVFAGPVMHPPLAYADPHLKERDYFVPITAPDVGTHLYPGTVFKMSKIPFQVRKPPVRLGEDNDYVYREVLKLTEEEY